ncbi:MFS general substrate transporter [Zalerion maritima]|uniref:MFS general substrate transporter n=1 Tax=Zalerion maritima TaxID=339359 RepID=A0AAD5RY85_9PEZI|nr:MFS general substrate transporter [Zalerion maritima]
MAYDNEKGDIDVVHDSGSGKASPTAIGSHPDEFGFTEKEQRAIVHRVDRRLVVTVGALYCVSLMDRTNLSAANIAGMKEELLLIDNRYVSFAPSMRFSPILPFYIDSTLQENPTQTRDVSIVTLVFFITYIICQPPSTIIIRKLGPRIHLSAITLLWGACMIGMGFVKKWEELVALRLVLGILEAGFFPSCVYLLSTWYTRFEVGKRYSVFYILGCVASAFAGILAYGLMQMDGLGDQTGWRWIFIIEGVLTCVLAVGAYWLLVDFPDSTRLSWNFIGQRQRDWIVARVQQDRGDSRVTEFSWAKFFKAGLDIKIWGYAMIFFGTTTVSYALAYFMPIILRYNMGFSIAESQCLVAPPYVFAGVIMYTTGWAGDKWHIRGPIIIFNMVLCIIGMAIMGFHPNSNVRYFGVFLCTAGANSNIPATMSYQANNIRGQWKRAFCSATLVGFGGIGGIAGSLVFRDQDAPYYKPGLYACIACALLNILIVCALTATFKVQNKKADDGTHKLEDHDNDMDHDARFRYTY